MSTQLYIIPTPIGNLSDMTYRAVETLRQVDLILAEDTRTSAKLLKHYEISKPMKSYHMHNEHKIVSQMVEMMAQGTVMALVTDAGTPGISDPGFLLIRECIENDITVSCLPGATAFVPALVSSGFPCDKFVFEGFLPVKKGRQKRLKELSMEKRSIAFYESPHKLLRLLGELATYFGAHREISISRELTKIYEETLRGSVEQMTIHFTEKAPKGEFVVIIRGVEE